MITVDPGTFPILPEVSLGVFAVMLEPSDDAKRARIVASQNLAFFLEAVAQGLVNQIPANQLLEWKQVAPWGEDSVDAGTALRGWAAGSVLLRALEISHFHPARGEAAGKAQEQVAKMLDGTILRNGHPPSFKGRTNVKAAWLRFRSVAHLWAAFVLSIEGFDWIGPPGEPKHLAVAEKLRVRGEGVRVPRGKATTQLLPPGAAWRVDPRLALPTVTVEPGLSVSSC